MIWRFHNSSLSAGWRRPATERGTTGSVDSPPALCNLHSRAPLTPAVFLCAVIAICAAAVLEHRRHLRIRAAPRRGP